MYMTARIRSSDVKKIEPIMFYEGINTKVFRHSIAFAIALAVLFCFFVALRPKSTAMVIAGRSVHLTTLFPGQA